MRALRRALSATVALLVLSRAAPNAGFIQSDPDFGSQTPFLTTSPHDGKRILIVGAGTAGIAALKALMVDLPEETRQGWEVVVAEQRSRAGGVWLADNVTHPEPPELPDTPLYPQLVTNTPHPTMTIPHFPFRPETPLFPEHSLVQQYHDDILAHFNLAHNVRFNTEVLETRWQGDRWLVSTKDRKSGVTELAEFDHLIVANGCFHYPREPVFEGRAEWEAASENRTIIHSVYFRDPSVFAGKNVLVVGSSASGQDVAKHGSKFANSTTIAFKNVPYLDADAPPDIPGVSTKPRLSHFTKDAVVFDDGSQLSEIDAVVLATGYDLKVPFLTRGGLLPEQRPPDSNSLSTNMRYIRPLWRHIFALDPELPPTALSFVGLPIFVANALDSSAQGLLIGHALANPGILPTRAEMLNELHAREDAERAAGLDPEYIGHRILALPGEDPLAGMQYTESLVRYLQEHGLSGVGTIPPLGKNFTDPWRIQCNRDTFLLRRTWKRVEALGPEAAEEWVSGVKSEQDWVKMMDRLAEWGRQQEDEDELSFPLLDGEY
ncbi:FAD/NAD-P-binding domain-containing protein [Peniophora sp. CONT]|nr:FAD/NAD-P-binding domain-containing protein [Peniophora sp. CONT]